MNVDNLLEQILSLFKEYGREGNVAVIKKKENSLILRKPNEANYILYEIRREYGRESGCIENFQDFLEIASEEFIDENELKQVGSEMNIVSNGYEYSNYGFYLERKNKKY